MRRIRFEAADGAVHDAVVDGNVCVSERDPELRVEPLDLETLQLPQPFRQRRPVDPPEVWCAGVTYERSRDARIEESGRDVYALVYDADRPELFLKDAGCRRTVGPGEPIAVRGDSRWNVPEPEIGLVLGDLGSIAGVTIGNDVSSRDIEGANPLYLPQAKVYAGACALGPAVLTPAGDAPFDLTMRILAEDGAERWSGSTSTARMRRSFAELVEWLRRDNPVPPGSVLLTGTGLVPPDELTLEPGQIVEIDVPGIGRLKNPVVSAHELLERSPTHVRDADRSSA
jgi:2-dehydro-3-deoxy-D-arabinonate dehydratase